MLSFFLPFNLFIASAHAQCPEEKARGIRVVEDFLTQDRYAQLREEHDVLASVDSIRVLNEEQDLEACSYFSSVLDFGDEARYRTYYLYKAEDYYFVLHLLRPRDEWPDPEVYYTGREIGAVYDQDFEPLFIFVL